MQYPISGTKTLGAEAEKLMSRQQKLTNKTMKKITLLLFVGITMLSKITTFAQLSTGNGTISPNVTPTNQNVGIGTTSPKEKFQIGDIWTFHSGGSKVIGYNSHYDGISSRRIQDGYASSISQDVNGAIHFKVVGFGNANSVIVDQTALSILNNGNFGKVQIGEVATPGNYRLYVEKGILTENLNIAIKNTTDWADYVFDENYNLTSLEETEEYIKEHKHLPNVPSSDEMVEKGMDVKKTNAMLMAKIEELTLYVIALNKKIEVINSINK